MFILKRKNGDKLRIRSIAEKEEINPFIEDAKNIINKLEIELRKEYELRFSRSSASLRGTREFCRTDNKKLVCSLCEELMERLIKLLKFKEGLVMEEYSASPDQLKCKEWFRDYVKEVKKDLYRVTFKLLLNKVEKIGKDLESMAESVEEGVILFTKINQLILSVCSLEELLYARLWLKEISDDLSSDKFKIFIPYRIGGIRIKYIEIRVKKEEEVEAIKKTVLVGLEEVQEERRDWVKGIEELCSMFASIWEFEKMSGSEVESLIKELAEDDLREINSPGIIEKSNIIKKIEKLKGFIKNTEGSFFILEEVVYSQLKIFFNLQELKVLIKKYKRHDDFEIVY